MNRKYLLGGVASAALMSAAASVNAAVVTTTLRLVDNTGTELPKIGDIYQVQPGSTFDVILGAVVTQPNMSEASRGAATAGKPLGLQTFSTDIISTGTGTVTPVKTAGGQWDNDGSGAYTDLTEDGFGPQFVNVADKNGDGKDDVAGAGMVNINITLPNTATGLRRVQYGIVNNDLAQGEYRAGTTPGLVTLRTAVSSNNLFVDPPGGGLELTAPPALDAVVNGQIQIQVGTVQPGGGTVGLGTTPNAGTAITLNITGANGSYSSSVFDAGAPGGNENVVQGNANLSAIGQEGAPLVLIRFSDTDGATGPALPAFIDTITASDGSTLARVTGAEFTALAAAYPFLNDPNAAVFRLTDPDRIFNFDFTGQGGIGIAQLAAVPEPTVIGLVGIAGLGLLSRRRRNA